MRDLRLLKGNTDNVGQIPSTLEKCVSIILAFYQKAVKKVSKNLFKELLRWLILKCLKRTLKTVSELVKGYSTFMFVKKNASKRTLTILTWKNLCFTEFSTKIHWNTRFAASRVFHMFTQSFKFLQMSDDWKTWFIK